jgi:hypothetical protein
VPSARHDSGGAQANLFSSFPKKTIEKHFEWMRTYQIDGALIQRFINSIPQQREECDAVLKNVRTSVQTTGRVFAVEYDLSGAHADTVFQQLEEDWRYLTDNLHIISSSAYLKRNGKSVVSIWGLVSATRITSRTQSSRSRSFAGFKQRHMPLSWEESPGAGGR